MLAERLAKLISRLFDLYTWSIILNFLFLYRSNLTSPQVAALIPIVVLLELILPVIIFAVFLKKGIISDVDITRREQRPRFFSVLAALMLVGSAAGYVYGNPLFFWLQLTVLATIMIMVVITLFWKISGHTMVNSLGIFFLNYFFAGKFWWLYFLLLPVAWSRWHLKKHSPLQLLAGAVLGLAVPLVMLKLGGFL